MTLDEARIAVDLQEDIEARTLDTSGWLPAVAAGIVPGDMLVRVTITWPNGQVVCTIRRPCDLRKVPDA